MPSDDLPFADRRHFWLVSFYALAGDLDQAQSYLSAFETEATEDQKRAEEDALLQARGLHGVCFRRPRGCRRAVRRGRPGIVYDLHLEPQSARLGLG